MAVMKMAVNRRNM